MPQMRIDDAEGFAENRPPWSVLLRALREARGITQDGWAARLGYSRATVQRWESGEAIPDAQAERAIIEICQAQGLFRTFEQGVLRGRTVTPASLQALLADARLATTPAPVLEHGEAPAEEVEPATAAARLIERADGRTLTVHRLGTATLIGRREDNDIVVPVEQVSRHHARIERTGARYVLHDLGSRNGTFLNGERVIDPEPLRDGDQVNLAGSLGPTFEFEAAQETAVAPLRRVTSDS